MRLLILCLFALCSSLFAEHPNVLMILADDLGWSDTSLYGTTTFYQTPNIERLAKRGMTFTHAYSASPLCSPTRSALLTGLSPARTGITTPNCHLPRVVLEATLPESAAPNLKAIQPNPPTRLKTEYLTLAETLKEAGYATAHFGKWHLGPEPYSPLQHGFDLDLPHHPGPGPAGSYGAPWKFTNFKEKAPDEHIEDRMAAEAVAWMEQQKGKPFYLNYWMFSVHSPFDAKKENILQHRRRTNPKDAQRSPTYAAMIQSMDDAVGTLLDALDRLGLTDNTIVIFTSDNGGNMYDEIDGTTPTSNRPLRGGKATLYEGGTRVPCVIIWPGITKPSSRSDALIQSEDFYPTLLEGLSLQPGQNQVFDGTSILPALKGDSLRAKAVFQYFPHAPGVPDWLPPAISVHRDDWKLIRIFHGGDKGAHRYMLFHLRDDLGEQNNLAAAHPSLVAELDALIEAFLADTKAVQPIPNPAFDPAKYRPDLEGKQIVKKKKITSTAVTSSAAPSTAWQTSRDATAESIHGTLQIQSSGRDPYIFRNLPPPPLTGPLTLKLRLTSTGEGSGVVYFAAPNSRPTFQRERSVSFVIHHDGQPHEYTVPLPIQELSAIRFDPGNAVGKAKISQMTLYDAAGTMILDLLTRTPETAPAGR
jgi:arylsulfatase A-like enzyme